MRFRISFDVSPDMSAKGNNHARSSRVCKTVGSRVTYVPQPLVRGCGANTKAFWPLLLAMRKSIAGKIEARDTRLIKPVVNLVAHIFAWSKGRSGACCRLGHLGRQSFGPDPWRCALIRSRLAVGALNLRHELNAEAPVQSRRLFCLSNRNRGPSA